MENCPGLIVVVFDSEQDFENFKQDEERKKFLHLKEQSIKSVLLIKGMEL
jgi:heme-degrading monooxygenase HmoA